MSCGLIKKNLFTNLLAFQAQFKKKCSVRIKFRTLYMYMYKAAEQVDVFHYNYLLNTMYIVG